MKNLVVLLITFFALNSCKPTEVDPPSPPLEPAPETMYFPPLTGATWEQVSSEVLGWETNNEQQLFDFLQTRGTKSFIVLKKGRLVYEKYFDAQTVTSNWVWYSAAKTLTATTIGIAQQENLLDINAKTSDYLGTGWTSLSLAQENEITIKNHLSMNTGLDETTDWTCYTPSCFTYKSAVNSRWAYHQGAYTILQDVVANATSTTFENYFNTKLKEPIGMDGNWFTFGNLHLFKSTGRSMARFGLLMLNQGTWDGNGILSDVNYFNAMTNTSQTMNKSYGYLWWLCGKESSMGTADQTVLIGSLIPNAPDDTFCALGYQDQKIYVVPSQELVIIRMGTDAGGSGLAGSNFDNELWEKLNLVIRN
jgi:CubicO group peptidase (beta-lactamase class C family)